MPILYTTDSVPNALEKQQQQKKTLKQMFALNTLPYFTGPVTFFIYFYSVTFSSVTFFLLLFSYNPDDLYTCCPRIQQQTGMALLALPRHELSFGHLHDMACVCKCSLSIVCRTLVPCTYARQKI